MAWYRMMGKNRISFFLHEQFDPLRSWKETSSNGLLRLEEEYETAHSHPAFRQIFCSNAKVFTYTAVKPGGEQICFRLAHMLDSRYDLNDVFFSMEIGPDLSIRVWEYGEFLNGLNFYHYLDQKPRLSTSFCPGAGEFADIGLGGPYLALRPIPEQEDRYSQSMPGEDVTLQYELCGVRPGQQIVRYYRSEHPCDELPCTVLAAFTVKADVSVRLDGMIEAPNTQS